MGTRCEVSNLKSAAVPATVSGERSAITPLGSKQPGKAAERDRAVSQETCRCTSLVRPAGSSRRTGTSPQQRRGRPRAHSRAPLSLMTRVAGDEARLQNGEAPMRFILRAALLAATSFTALPAHAFDTDDDVVTVTRQPSRSENLPADVDVIDTDAALLRGDANVAEALADVPGLGVVRSGGFG